MWIYIYFFAWSRLCSGLSLWCDCSPQLITSDRAPWYAASKKKKTKTERSSPFSSAGGTCALMLRHVLWLAKAHRNRCPFSPRHGNASAYRAHMFGDRWSQRACRDCLRWAPHLPLARNRATAGQGLHGGKEESVRAWVQLQPLWPRGKREMSGRPEKPDRHTGQVEE